MKLTLKRLITLSLTILMLIAADSGLWTNPKGISGVCRIIKASDQPNAGLESQETEKNENSGKTDELEGVDESKSKVFIYEASEEGVNREFKKYILPHIASRPSAQSEIEASVRDTAGQIDTTLSAGGGNTASLPDSENSYFDKAVQDDSDFPSDTINFIRAIHGLEPIKENPLYSYYSQKGLDFLIANNQKINHHAASGSGDLDADKGLQGSNLTSRENSGGVPVEFSNANMIFNFLVDLGNNNLAEAGHRRWLLNDKCGEMGFARKSNYNGSRIDGALYVVDESADVAQSGVVTFPSAGDYPIEVVTQFHNRNNFTWSVMLGDALAVSNPNSLSVSVTRKSDNRTLNLRQSTVLSANEDWFTYDQSKVGSGAAIIFNPASFINSQPEKMVGETYQVDIKGFDGNNSSISYDVHFFSLEENADKLIGDEGLSIKPNTTVIAEGEEHDLKQDIPQDNLNPQGIWMVENENVATVDQDGMLTGVKSGKTVAMHKNSGGNTNRVYVFVEEGDPEPPGIEKESLKLQEGDTEPLGESVFPQDSEYALTWTASDPFVAIINALGEVRALNEGETTITVKSANEPISVIQVVVQNEPEFEEEAESIKISPKKATIDIGDTLQLSVSAKPKGTSIDSDDLDYEVEDPTVAMVDSDGLLTGLSNGETIIEAITEDGLSASMKIIVSDSDSIEENEEDLENIQLFEDSASKEPLILTPDSSKDLILLKVSSDLLDKVKWSFTNSGIASMRTKDGYIVQVSGLKPGETTIQAKTPSGKLIDEREILVLDENQVSSDSDSHIVTVEGNGEEASPEPNLDNGTVVQTPTKTVKSRTVTRKSVSVTSNY